MEDVVAMVVKKAVENGYVQPAISEIASIAGYDDEDAKRAEIYWDAAFNKSWLYFSDEMMFDQMGYVNKPGIKPWIYGKLEKKYIEGVDYKEVGKDDLTVKFCYMNLCSKKDARGGSNRRYFLITGETMKDLAMGADTEKGKAFRFYYIKTERLAMIMKTAIIHIASLKSQHDLEAKMLEEKEACAARLAEKDRQIDDLKSRMIKVTKMVAAAEPMEKNEFIYIASSKQYAQMNCFKVGGTTDLKKRIGGYGTGRLKEDSFDYIYSEKCHSYNSIETWTRQLLKPYLDKKDSKKEMYMVAYEPLADLVSTITRFNNQLVDYINEHADEIFEKTIGDGVPLDELVAPESEHTSIEYPCEDLELPGNVYVTHEIIMACGYISGQYSNQKASLMRHLHRKFIPGKDFWILKNDEYKRRQPVLAPHGPDPDDFFNKKSVADFSHVITTRATMLEIFLAGGSESSRQFRRQIIEKFLSDA